MASRRPTSAADQKTDINIWVSTRAKQGDDWGAPVLVGPPVSIDMTQTLQPSRSTTFARRSPVTGMRSTSCRTEMATAVQPETTTSHATRLRGDGGVDPVESSGCDVNNNGERGEPIPAAAGLASGPVLYFRAPSPAPGDLYYSRWIDRIVPGTRTGTGREHRRMDRGSTQPSSRRAGDLLLQQQAQRHRRNRWQRHLRRHARRPPRATGKTLTVSGVESQQPGCWKPGHRSPGMERRCTSGRTVLRRRPRFDHYVTKRALAP